MKIANALIVLMLAAGCGPDPQAAELESQIKQLTAERDEAQADLAAAKGEANRLRRQLAAKERQRVEAVREASDLRDEARDAAALRDNFEDAQRLAIGRFIILERATRSDFYLGLAAQLDPGVRDFVATLGERPIPLRYYLEMRRRIASTIGQGLVSDLMPPDLALNIRMTGRESDETIAQEGLTGERLARARAYREADIDGKALLELASASRLFDGDLHLLFVPASEVSSWK